MSPRPSPIIIVAALLTNLPLSLGAAAGPQPNDDEFLRLTGTALRVHNKDAHCSFTSGRIMKQDWTSLEFGVGKTTLVQTLTVLCPKADDHNGFMSKFTAEGRPENVLLEFLPSRLDGKRKFVFDGPPPEPTGLDPLRKIGNSTLRDKRASLELAASKLRLPRHLSFVTESYLKARRGGKEVFTAMQGVCYALRATLKVEFGTVKSLCDIYRNVSRTAVNTAWQQQQRRWDFLNNGPVTYISVRLR
ncbi:hypothetical protein FOZ63_008334 [Perkinsus olseni]|uniref:Uncharacterized protein n=1 Tax=Perkinsus olseni TaxID=32597 RepID=A0A7J6SZS1_PEROL|nr:hypothetical protein FOZ60_005840 [Perkinsus olseni]KAF4705006.1 hypothetical protein FOZ62_026504 [Perkinsus olseni]KAF4738464.1 hypothetical protein FOZ63_008334 [Perkinsus olseni]